MKILDTAVRLVARQPVFLFELAAITARYYPTDAQLDPIFVLFGLFFGRRNGLAIALTGAQPSGGKSSRANQHKEFARCTYHKIDVSI